MQDLPTLLSEAVQKFFITTTSNASFWAPYLRNDLYVQDSSAPRGLGKSYPSEISIASNYVVSRYPDCSGDTIRLKLTNGSLDEPTYNYKGIDCSGFVYIVYEYIYSKLHSTRFSDYLFVPKAQVLNGALNYTEWHDAYALGSAEASALPEDVPMSWVVDTFNRKPINLCNVSALVLKDTSNEIQLADARAGDFIHLLTIDDQRNHVAIIMEVNHGEVQIAHSTKGNSSDIGGVVIESLPIIDSQINTNKMSNPHSFVSIRRPMGLWDV